MLDGAGVRSPGGQRPHALHERRDQGLAATVWQRDRVAGAVHAARRTLDTEHHLGMSDEVRV